MPLNGNLDNNGISDIILSGSPNSWGTTGKIGKCATFTGSTANVIYNNTTDFNYTDNFSWALWVNTNYTGTTAQYAFTNGRADAGGYGYGLQCSSTTTCTVRYGNKSWSVAITGGTWTHLAFTKSGTTIKIYVNGSLYSTNTFSGTTPTYSDGNGLGLGCFHYSGNIYPFYGSLNDFRIYDHCLSAKEVKEISKALVLHYPLNQTERNVNLSTIASVAPALPNAAGTSAYSVTTDGISTRITCTTAGTGGRYNTCFSNDVRTASTVYTWSADVRASRALTGVTIGLEGNGTTTFNLTTEWQRVGMTATLATDTYSAFILYPYSATVVGDWIEIKNVKVEQGSVATPWCPCSNDNPTWTDNIEYDVSGYGNNGSIAGTITLTDNSLRNNNCYYFPIATSATNKIISPALTFDGKGITMSVWVKLTTGTAGGSDYHMPLESSTAGYYEMSISSGGLLRAGVYVNGTRYVENCSNPSMFDGKWHMIALTYDGSTINRYVDGVSYVATTIAGTANGTSQAFYIGSYGTNTTYYNKGVYESDARIYTTALSANDIKTLYENSVSITKNGALMTQGEVIEE